VTLITSTPNVGLVKYWRGHPTVDLETNENLDIIDAAYQAGVKVVKSSLASGDADDYAFTWQNPESSEILVRQVIIDVVTAGGTANSVLDVDVVADATSTADTIFDGINLNAVGISSSTNVADTGTNGDEEVKKVDANGGTNDWITGKILVANAASLVGKYYIEYIVV